jgi:uncharacterized protein YdhG (YjbR/CyaY superfamily)
MGDRSSEVDHYLAQAPENHRDALVRLRDLIHEIHPGIEETIQYKMPTFSLDQTVTGFASRAQYISLYCKPEVVDGYREELGKLNVGKGCIRFRKIEDLPLEVVKEIIRQSV